MWRHVFFDAFLTCAWGPFLLITARAAADGSGTTYLEDGGVIPVLVSVGMGYFGLAAWCCRYRRVDRWRFWIGISSLVLLAVLIVLSVMPNVH